MKRVTEEKQKIVTECIAKKWKMENIEWAVCERVNDVCNMYMYMYHHKVTNEKAWNVAFP